MRTGRSVGLAVAASFAVLLGLTLAGTEPSKAAQRVEGEDVPKYRYDPTWPKPLPNAWIVQSVTGIVVDRQDNIWILNNPDVISEEKKLAEMNPPVAECCRRAPAVIKFSPQGDVLAAWGGTNYVPGWPQSVHTIFTDGAGNVWLAGAAAGDTLLEFTPDGKLLRDFGKRGPRVEGPATAQQQNNQQTELLLRGVAAATLDEPAREIYVADGYLNKRVLVFDLETGAFKRGWGAYGTPLADISNARLPPHTPNAPVPREFRGPVHCVQIANDGLVYVCDRGGNRIQVFNKQGQFQKEFIVANHTLVRGSVGSVSFSPDREQRFIFVADIQNGAVWILERQTGKVVGRFGYRSFNGGDFMLIHGAASDSHGNIYTAEILDAARVQKFVPVR